MSLNPGLLFVDYIDYRCDYGEDGRVSAVRAPDPDDEAQTVKAVKCKVNAYITTLKST